MSEAPPSAADVFAASRNHLIRRVAGLQKLMGAGAYAISAEGAEVRLSDGRRLLDLGTWASSILGHRPPSVVAAVKEQLDTLPTAPRGLANECTPLLARRLAVLAAPSRLEKVWLGANGADVVEAALKLARLATARLRILAVRGGFHGRTLGALAVSDADRYHADLAPLLRQVTFLEPVPEAVEREVASGDVAAVILEVIQGSRAVEPLPGDMLRRWTRAAQDAGTMVIIDEVQTGLWRCGSFSLGLSLGLDPDAVLLGKSLGGGVMPLAALLCTAGMAAGLEDNPFLHSQTFSGHPLACAAGLAALDAVTEAAAAHSQRVTDWLTLLRARLARHPEAVGQVSIYGLMMGIQFRSPQFAEHFLMAAARGGVLLAPSDCDRSFVRILPPLVLQDAQMAEVVAVLDEICTGQHPWSTPAAGNPVPAGNAESRAAGARIAPAKA